TPATPYAASGDSSSPTIEDSPNWKLVCKLRIAQEDLESMPPTCRKIALICWVTLIAGVSVAQQWQDVYGGSLSCKDRAAVMSFTPGDYQKGVSFVSLRSGLTKWQSIPDEITELQPVIAADTVAILTNECHTISAFDVTTGQLIWRKENWSNVLESDGKYFYV